MLSLLFVKPPPVKTNPSKRHRDRLNVELDHLTSLLPFPEDVRGRLDKLSVLRLSVGYLKVKGYFHAVLQKRSAVPANGTNAVSLDGVSFSEGDLLLQALNGFVLVVTSDGTVFYASPTIGDFLGFHQSDVVQQSVFDLVHVDDRETFKCQLHFSLNPDEGGSQNGQSGSKTAVNLLPQHIPPENSSFLDRSFCCRLRSLLDNTSGFLAVNFSGRLKYLHLQGAGADPPQLALFAIATALQPPSVMEIRTKTFIFQTKHRMDFAPVGIDTRGKLVLGYSEIELVTTGSGYQFIHAADMMYCADNHLKMMKTGDSGFTFFRLLTKTGRWLWVQASARIVFKGGRPDFIIARQKALTNEEGEEHLHQRRQQLPFNLATGEGVLYDSCTDAFSMSGPPGSGTPGASEPTTEEALDPASLLGSLQRQDRSVYMHPQKPSPQLPVFPQIEELDLEQPQSSMEQAFLDSHALLSVPSESEASQARSVTMDVTSEAMIDSLEQILRDIGGGGIDGVDVEETELRDWENTLCRMNNEREDASQELNQILANDVFSYVEEALRRETGGFVQGSDQTHLPVDGLSIKAQHPGSSEPPPTDPTSGGVVSGVGCSTGLNGASHVVCHRAAHTWTHTQQGHTCRLEPPGSSNHHCGSQMISTQSCHVDHSHPHASQQSWLPFVQSTDGTRGSRRPGSEETQLQSLWHTLTHSSHTPGSLNSTASSLLPQMQRLSGSCMYETREGHMANAATVPVRQNGPLLGATSSRGPSYVAGVTANGPVMPSYPGVAAGGLNQGPAACTDVGNISLVHVSGGSAGRGTARPESGSLQSSFFCWNGEDQIPKVPLNGVADPFAFPALPAGSINLSQNSGT
uniref:aryl hydrocarbon receptor-like isoform X2 n=1 Tax=Scatophagus argus TaxID=75038 RepID=UPI001ED7D780|nr:aryl hydrocarbon receptor-like isoform X2 [Scatophagus argus]